jgi:hypothetical protein
MESVEEDSGSDDVSPMERVRSVLMSGNMDKDVLVRTSMHVSRHACKGA